MSALNIQTGDEEAPSQSNNPQGVEASRLKPVSPANSRASGQNVN